MFLEENGIAEKSSDTSYQTMSQRDYVMVNFSPNRLMNKKQHFCNRLDLFKIRIYNEKYILLYEFVE